MNGIPLKSMLLNGTSVNSMVSLMGYLQSQCYWREHQRIQCYDEWNPTEVNVIEWDISGFNGIINGIPSKSMLLKGTSVNSML
jgi:hypothetical protein